MNESWPLYEDALSDCDNAMAQDILEWPNKIIEMIERPDWPEIESQISEIERNYNEFLAEYARG